MAEMNDAQKQMKNFADNLKKTALGVSFARKIFTEPTALSPKQITEALKALGINIPPEIEATAEVAQIIMTGQAINDALQAGRTIDEVRSLTNATAASVRITNQIAAKNGWIDQDTASIVSYGTNTFMIVSSGGSNVAAWIGLAMDIASTIANKQAQADINALRDLSNKYSYMYKGQSKILGETFKDFQSGNISIYGLISKMAVETPALWPQVIKQDSPFVQMFPDLMMVPTVTKTINGYGESRIWGDWPWPASGSYVLASWSSHKSIDYMQVKDFTKEEAASYFFNVLLKPWVMAYSLANDEIVGRGNMSMMNVAALSYLINPGGKISATDNYVAYLLGSNLTPYDFGDNILDSLATNYLEDSYANVEHTFHEQAISKGVSVQNAGFSSYQTDADITRAKLQEIKQTNNIWELVKYPQIATKLQSYMDFETTWFEKDPTVGGKINAKFSNGQVTAWRELNNYIAVMQMLDTFRTDSYLRNTKFAETLLPFMPSVTQFQELTQKINYLSVTRSVNDLALKNVASFLDVKPSQLVKVSGNSVGPAKYTIK